MKMKKVVAMVSALAMVAGLCTSAAADEAATDSDLSEHVEITIGGINVNSSDSKEGWPNEVVQKLEDKFNVTLTLKSYDNESLNLDLSGGNTTDIVQINDDHIPTTKQDPLLHGFGIGNVKDILEKYHAEYLFNYDDGRFIFSADWPDISESPVNTSIFS